MTKDKNPPSTPPAKTVPAKVTTRDDTGRKPSIGAFDSTKPTSSTGPKTPAQKK